MLKQEVLNIKKMKKNGSDPFFQALTLTSLSVQSVQVVF